VVETFYGLHGNDERIDGWTVEQAPEAESPRGVRQYLKWMRQALGSLTPVLMPRDNRLVPYDRRRQVELTEAEAVGRVRRRARGKRGARVGVKHRLPVVYEHHRGGGWRVHVPGTKYRAHHRTLAEARKVLRAQFWEHAEQFGDTKGASLRAFFVEQLVDACIARRAGWWTSELRTFPGAFSQGRTSASARANLIDAIGALEKAERRRSWSPRASGVRGRTSWWNHRLLVEVQDGKAWWTIREVHYNRDRVVAWSAEPSAPGGETLVELEDDLARMRTALDLPCLVRQGDKLEPYRPATKPASPAGTDGRRLLDAQIKPGLARLEGPVPGRRGEKQATARTPAGKRDPRKRGGR
jgi:hypothetical protein